MRDFTLTKYTELLNALAHAGYRFVTMEELKKLQDEGSQEYVVCLRHDVDLRPFRALKLAFLEHHYDIHATYYFRSKWPSDNRMVIRKIASFGHEIGYHYEDMSILKGHEGRAWVHFQKHLHALRKIYPVKTICMHGAPTSKWDSRELWMTRDYKTLGIICEPYLDLDYSHLFYLTDTGRKWDGANVSVRDKIPGWQDEWVRQGLSYHTTDELIYALEDPASPIQKKSLLITTHPQRWTNRPLGWLWQLLAQNAKNVIKKQMVKHKK